MSQEKIVTIKFFNMTNENNSQLKVEIMDFVNHWYLKNLGVQSIPPTKILAVAYQKKTIIGTLGINFSNEKEQFLLEKHFKLQLQKAPFPFEREKIAHLTRWISILPNASLALSFVATKYCLRKGKKYGIGEFKVKKIVSMIKNKFNCAIYPYPDTELRIENITEMEKNYFINDPQPNVYMWDLEETYKQLLKNMQLLIQSGEIIIQMVE